MLTHWVLVVLKNHRCSSLEIELFAIQLLVSLRADKEHMLHCVQWADPKGEEAELCMLSSSFQTDQSYNSFFFP